MLAFVERGQGPAVVLLHGFPLSHAIWQSQGDHLSARYRVIMPDLPGHGASAVQEGISIADMAREVLRLLDHLGVAKAAVAGHSMGGYVTLAMQQEAPERIAGLALICSQAGDDTPEGRQGRFALAERVGAEGAEPVAQGMLPKLFATPDGAGEGRDLTAHLIRSTAPAGIQAALHAMAGRPDLRPLLPTITRPTLVLTGLDDRVIPVERSEGMAAQVPTAVLVKVEGAGHMPMLEQPKAVSQALAQWLELVY